MGATPDEVHPFKVFEAVVRTEVEHLAEIVGEIERRPAVDLVVILPVIRRDHLLKADPLPDAVDPHPLELVEGHLAVARGLAAPVDVGVAVGDRDQQVERTVAGGGEGGIGDAGVLHIHRRIRTEGMTRLDVGEVVAVVGRQIDGVMGHVILPLDPEVEHERRA